MKKIILILFFVFLVSGCANKNAISNYRGKVTTESQKYLDKGYQVNIYRDIEKLGDDAENYGKGYIRMNFNVTTDYYSTNEYNPDADYNIKKKIISNVRVIKQPKMGMAEELYVYNSQGTLLSGTNNKYKEKYDIPHTSGVQSSVAVAVNKIAFLDTSTYGFGEMPGLSKIYSDLNVTTENVTLTLGFRVELVTKDDKIFYKDYEIILPPSSFNISGAEYSMDFIEDDVSEMEPFLEKQ